jgi:hypothetical protein
MSVKRILLLSVLLAGFTGAQKLAFENSFGSFDGASSFSYVTTGFFYVACEGSETVVKIDTNGNETASVGGYGWEQSAFDDPVDVFATPLKVYVADKNNNRIQVFDRFLNYQFEIKDEATTVFPQSVAVSDQGDVFILDSDNLRILKFDMFGNFIDEIGTITSGKFTFVEPKKLAISQNNDLFVLDKKRILIFDLFGNGKQIYTLPFEAENINIFGKIITVNGLYEIISIDLRTGKTNLLNKISKHLGADFIVDSVIIRKKLYVLTQSQILVFKISSVKKRSGKNG